MEKTADRYLQELYSYDYDDALDYRDGLERGKGTGTVIAAPDAPADGCEYKEAV
jgi:hypothetical protein